MNNEINSWLNSERDYAIGVQLYSRFGQSQNMKRIFERSDQSERSTQNLIYELEKLQHVSPALPKRSTPVLPPQIAAIANQYVSNSNSHSRDDQLLFDQIKSKLKIRDHLHATLELVPEDQRRLNALQILDLSDEITKAYERHEHFKTHGVLPPEQEIKEVVPDKSLTDLSEAELLRRRSNIRSKISYYKKQIGLPEKAASIIYNAGCLSKWEAQLSQILQLLP